MSDESIENLDALFPDGIQLGHALLSPMQIEEVASGLIQTEQGLAIVSSAAIFWNNGAGFNGKPGGHFVLGRLLEAGKMESLSRTMLTPIDLLAVEESLLPEPYHESLMKLTVENQPYAIVRQGDSIYGLKLLRDISGQELAILRVELEANISKLGARTVHTVVLMLVVTAFTLTLTLWFALKGLLLLPIERLTAVFRSVDQESSAEGSGRFLLSTVQRLADSRGLITQRNDEIGELISAFDDLSSSLSDASASVWRAAHLDGLTGLANRRLFMERLQLEIDHVGAERRQLAVLFIDLDDFKIINDRLGHNAGDQILVDVAARMNSLMGLSDHETTSRENGQHNLVARIGGDEFVVLLTTQDTVLQAEQIAASIVEAIAAPFVVCNEQCQIGACVGLALFPGDADVLHELLSNADAAMYEAKRAGKNSWRRYVPGLSRLSDQKSA